MSSMLALIIVGIIAILGGVLLTVKPFKKRKKKPGRFVTLKATFKKDYPQVSTSNVSTIQEIQGDEALIACHTGKTIWMGRVPLEALNFIDEKRK